MMMTGKLGRAAWIVFASSTPVIPGMAKSARTRPTLTPLAIRRSAEALALHLRLQQSRIREFQCFNHSDGGSEDPIIVIDNQDDRIRLGLRMQLGVNRFLFAIFLNKFNAGHEDLYRGAQADAGVNHHVAA